MEVCWGQFLRLGVWLRLPAWLGSAESSPLDPSLHLLLVSLHGGKTVRELSGVLFIRVLILFKLINLFGCTRFWLQHAGALAAAHGISNRRHADDTTLMAESEELKGLLMKVKVESEKVG